MSHNHYTQFFFTCQVLATKKTTPYFLSILYLTLSTSTRTCHYQIAKNVSKKKINRIQFRFRFVCRNKRWCCTAPISRFTSEGSADSWRDSAIFWLLFYGAVKSQYLTAWCCESLYSACFHTISRCYACVLDLKSPFPRRCASIATIF